MDNVGEYIATMIKLMNYLTVEVILLHNHPGREVVPSKSDYDFTNSAEQILSTFNIRLIEHVIVGEDKYHLIMKSIMQSRSVLIEYDAE